MNYIYTDYDGEKIIGLEKISEFMYWESAEELVLDCGSIILMGNHGQIEIIKKSEKKFLV